MAARDCAINLQTKNKEGEICRHKIHTGTAGEQKKAADSQIVKIICESAAKN